MSRSRSEWIHYPRRFIDTGVFFNTTNLVYTFAAASVCRTSQHRDRVKNPKRRRHFESVSPTNPKLDNSFEFVCQWFYSHNDTESVMWGWNATLIHAGAAEELVKGKVKRKKERRQRRRGRKDKNEHVIAVDWALSNLKTKVKIEE